MTSNYPNGFANGITLRNIPITIVPSGESTIFWVDSVHGSDGVGVKGSFVDPFASIAHAVAEIYALAGHGSGGDIIYVAAGHVETIVAAGTLTINVPGLTIVFEGEGTSKATLNYTTAIAASMIISAANVTLYNPRCTCNQDALTSPITITGANCQIANLEWYDTAAKAATNCVVASAAASGLKLLNCKFYASTTGTQKATRIQLTAVPNAALAGIYAVGDFSNAPIYFPSACTSIVMDSMIINNTNVGPQPGINPHANTTGMVKNTDIRIASGTTYVTTVAKLNWDGSCLGYNGDGKGGDPIGSADNSSVEGKLDLIQDDLGNPSARSNAQSIETMLGIPDAGNSTVYDFINGNADTSATAPAANGSIVGRLEVIQAALASPQGDLYKLGTCDVGMVASATNIVCADLSGAGDDTYNTKYYLQVIRNNNSHGAAPETQIRQITDYTSATGTFVVNAFGANVEASDTVAIIHESLVSGTTALGGMVNTINTNQGDPSGHALTSTTAKIGNGATTLYSEVTKLDSASLAVNPIAGSLARFVASGGTALGTPLADSKSLVNAIGSDGTTAAAATAASAASLFGAIGTNEADVTTPFSSSNVQSNADGTVLEREEYIQSQVNKIDSVTMSVAPIAGSLASFVASGGTALGAPLADSKSLINCLGTDGTTAATATAASAVSLFGAIGTNEVDATTPFSSANVQANADGTVLEREEYIQVKADAINTNVGDPSGHALTSITAKLGNGATTVYAEITKMDGASLAVNPTAGSLARFIASGGTALGTALADSKSLVDAIGSNGTTLVYGSGSALGAIGTTFWIKKTMVSSDILSGAPVDITSASSGGELAVEDVILKTDQATGLAGGTNFELKTNNVRGQLNFVVETVANLGAAVTILGQNASVLAERTVVESGKKLQVQATVGDCTGAGEIDIYVKFRRLSAGAIIAAL